MEKNETDQMALNFNRMVREKMGDRVDDFCILDVIDDKNHRSFSVEFDAYNYYLIRLDYNEGRLSYGIMYGKKRIELENSQKWYDTADFDIFFKEFRTELELRIPDKFLKANGWL